MCVSTLDCISRQDSQDSACEHMKMALVLALAVYHLHFVQEGEQTRGLSQHLILLGKNESSAYNCTMNTDTGKHTHTCTDTCAHTHIYFPTAGGGVVGTYRHMQGERMTLTRSTHELGEHQTNNIRNTH